MTERVDSSGDLEEGESSSVGSLVETSSEDSEEDESSSVGSLVETLSEDSEEEADPQVKEEVGSRNDGIFISIEIHYM